jgi:hypothetical protein
MDYQQIEIKKKKWKVAVDELEIAHSTFGFDRLLVKPLILVIRVNDSICW